MTARKYEMAILQREDKIGLMLPNNLTKTSGYVKKLAFECDLMVKNNPSLAKCDPMTVMMGVSRLRQRGCLLQKAMRFWCHIKAMLYLFCQRVGLLLFCIEQAWSPR